MKKVMLMGATLAGKTTLLQRLQGREQVYDKTQQVDYFDDAIDTPGEYLENRRLYNALITSSFDADVIALVQSATDEMSFYPPMFAGVFNQPVIGIVTKADAADIRQLERAVNHLNGAGAERIFTLSSVTGEGIDALQDYLNALD
jgi:ethanolamine utilization protein EutP